MFSIGLLLLPGAFASLVGLPLHAESLESMREESGLPGHTLNVFRLSLILALTEIVFVASLVGLPGAWAGLVFRGDRDVELPRLSRWDVQETLLAAIAIYLLAHAIIAIPPVAIAWTLQPDPLHGDRFAQFLHHLPERARLAAQLVVGLGLLFGARGIVRWLRMARSAGRPDIAA